MALTRINNNSLSNVTAAGLPEGSVLQVVQESTTSSTEISSDTDFNDITGMSANITPTSTTSKILVRMAITVAAYHNGGGCSAEAKILRGSTSIFENVIMGRYESDDAVYSACILEKLDSPGTTNQVTYKLQGRECHGNTSVYFNDGGTGNDGSNLNYTATVTLMEIAGA